MTFRDSPVLGHVGLFPCRYLDAELRPRLLCVLDVSRAGPLDEGGQVEVHATHWNTSGFRAFLSGLSENLPLVKGLLHAISVSGECTHGGVLFRPIPDDHDKIDFAQGRSPSAGEVRP